MGSSSAANAAEFQSAGKPVAEPVYIVDANGNPISSTNALNVNASFSASSVAINDPTVTTQKMGVNAQGQITSQIADSAGTNIAGVDSSHNLLTKVNAALPAGTNVIGHVIADSGSTTAVTQATGSNLHAVLDSGSTTAVTQATGTNLHTVVDSGSITVTQGTGSNLHAVLDAGSAVIGHVIADSGSTTAVTQATASSLNAQVVGSVASAGSNAGNPVKIGGVFNTTQPTVTNGQIVDAQTTARGAQIVATGTDTFNVTVNAALPAGSAVIGSTTIQATSGTALVADQSNTELRVSTYVKTSAAGDTALTLGQTNMAGSLPVTLASNQSNVPGNLVQIGGSSISNTNPFITEANIQNWTRNGQAFYATTGNPVTATNTNVVVCDMSLFNASNSGKNVLIFSITVGANASAMGSNGLYVTTSDPSGGTGFTGTPISGNLKLGGSAPTASLSMSASGITTSVAKAGTYSQAFPVNGNVMMELLTNGATIFLPNGSANGIAVYHSVATAGQAYNCTVRWIEY